MKINPTGSGFIFVLDLTSDNDLILSSQMRWSDGLFDLAFTEDHPDILVTASGDGGVQLWNVTNPQVMSFKKLPITLFSSSIYKIYILGTNSGLEGTFERSLLSRLESNKTAADISQFIMGSNNQIGNYFIS